jgi:alpha-glucosidase/alpha-D-xyloside xylohydrolase
LFRSQGRWGHLRLPWGWDTGVYGPIERGGRPDASELHNAEVEPICRKYLELRYRLLPYNYTLMREACDAGLPPMRALWLHYPRDPAAVKQGDQYLWGRDMLVAPVVEKAAKTRRLYLPAGQWYDFWTAKQTQGSRWLDREVDLATMPLYVRAGAIIPLDPVRQYTSEKVSDPTVLNIYPGADGSFTLYDDDGTSLDYQKNLAEWTRFRWQDRTRTLTIEPAPGSKLQPARRFAVVVVSTGDRKTVEYGGRKGRIELGGSNPGR